VVLESGEEDQRKTALTAPHEDFPLQSKYIAHRGACGKTRGVAQNRRAYGGGKSEMRVLLSTNGSRGD